jgi:hypothetical protein
MKAKTNVAQSASEKNAGTGRMYLHAMTPVAATATANAAIIGRHEMASGKEQRNDRRGT